MATRAIGPNAPAANPLTFTLSPGMAPAAPLMRMLARFNREKVEAFAEISIALLDMMDGDPDLEDCTDAEDDFALSWRARGYGARHDADNEAGAYAEWHTLRAAQRKAGTCLVDACGHEDDEEDDCGEDDDPDSAVDDRGCDPDTDLELDECGPAPRYGADQSKGPLPQGAYCAKW